MKQVLFCILTTFLTIVLYSTTVNAQIPTDIKVAVINSLDFEDQNKGVKKILIVQKKLNDEFKLKMNELQAQQSKIETLTGELKNQGGVFNDKKYEELDKLTRDLKYKREDYESQYRKRHEALLNPVYQAIGNAIQLWSKQKGFHMMVDISKDNTGMFLWVEGDVVNNTTAELIAYLNSLP